MRKAIVYAPYEQMLAVRYTAIKGLKVNGKSIFTKSCC